MGKTLGTILQVAAAVAVFVTTGNVSLAVAAYQGVGVINSVIGLSGSRPKPDTAETAIKKPRPERVSAYGRLRLYGAWTVYETAGNGTAVDIFAIHDGKLDGIERRYLNDDQVSLSGEFVVGGADGRYGRNKVSFYTTDGSIPGAGGTTFSVATSLLGSTIWSSMVGLRAYIDTDARDVFICGLQFAASNQRGAVIPVSDMATGLFNDQFGKMYLPGEIALFDDRKITLYPTNFIDRRPIAAESITLSRGVENFTAAPAGFAGAQGMEVDPARLQNNDTLTIARHFAWPLRNQVQFRDLTVRKIVNADLTGKTVNALFVGDSKFDDPNTPSAVKAILAAKGATVNLRGTLFGYDKDSATIYHEGRSGRSLADYVGKDRTDMAYVSNPATYIAAANFPDKYAYNPFLSAGSGTGSYDGYIFDYAGYLTKYASIIGGTPNIVIVDLGTNDYPEWTDYDAMTDFVDVAITRIITSVRGAGAKVLFTPGAYAWSDYWAELSPRAWPAFMRGLLRAVNRVNQPLNTRVSSAFAQISPLAFSGLTVTNTDADTGLKTGTRADITHPKLEARVQFATAIAADIAAMI
ncbi:hypothetical protein [Novosphingobium sp. B1]|uniref:hypothetical protein n=1 Tax=Novosphingobium sp. B1 TaxID=1938756 RepID=UPI0009D91305|nr:hypothetical protein [Novosphingobium sp. B1]SMD05650.1 hypothetical protein SAMN06272759_1308 [Novosphingobium sp. B1]